jgi:uncharacterized membrane protein
VSAADENVERKGRIFGRPCFAGTLGAVLFLFASYWPTLMPRTFVAQGAISGLSAAFGYGVGVFAGWLVGLVLRRFDITPSERLRRGAWIVLGVLAGINLLVGGLWLWVRWQNDQRALLGMNDLSPIAGMPMLLVAAIVAVIFVLLGRLIGRGIMWIYRQITRAVPPAIASIATVIIVALITSFLLTDVARDGFTSWANTAYGTIDDGTADGIVQPTSKYVSGSPDSLAKWDTLGSQGRTFVASAESIDTIEKFGADNPGAFPPGTKVVEPIRVYAGIRSAGDVNDRAALAVKELERTGAFDRDVLAVVTVTGTGWVDPDAANALEVLHAGNTAMVGIQYSYLPSWIATLVDDKAAAQAGAALFDAVYNKWSTLPADKRPKLIIFGLSLGSFGAEASFAGENAISSVDNLVARSDGALLGGPTNDNEVHRQLTADRAAGSPVWRPVFDDGKTVRFANNVDELLPQDPGWKPPRLLYVQHGSDPVTFWSMDTLWSKPEWMNDPRAPDVPAGGPWVPFVTWTQGVFDLMAGFGAPPGHGHDYRLAWPGAWAQVVPPEGWTADDTKALNAFLAEQRAAEPAN